MISVAFKRGEGLYSVAIKALTGSQFSHVELWIGGPAKAAVCYSSREPEGSGFKVLDLTDKAIWETVEVPGLSNMEAEEERIEWFCRGSAGRPYDFIGIAGIGCDLRNLHVGAARFCSNEVFNVIQQVADLWPYIMPWMVAPGWPNPQKDRFGLYELVKAL